MKKIFLFFIIVSIFLTACTNSGRKCMAVIYLEIVNNTEYEEILGHDLAEVETLIRIDGRKVANLNIGEKAAIVIMLSKGTHKLKVGLKEASFNVTDTTTNTYSYQYLCNLLSYELQATTEEIVVEESDWIYID